MSCCGKICSALRQSCGFLEIFFRKLFQRTDIQDALTRIQEEVQIALVQILTVSTEVGDGILLCRRVAYVALNAHPLGANNDSMVMNPMWNDMEEVKRDVVEVKRDVVEVKRDVEDVKCL